MFDWIFGRELSDVLSETKKIKVKGIRFTIRKLDMANYLDGSDILFQTHDTHKGGGPKTPQVPMSEEKIKRHYSQVLVGAVVTPKMKFKIDKESTAKIVVEDLFIDWDLCYQLYMEIMEFTYGKKKVRDSTTAGKGS